MNEFTICATSIHNLPQKKFRRDPLLQPFFYHSILTTTLFFLSFFFSLFFTPSWSLLRPHSRCGRHVSIHFGPLVVPPSLPPPVVVSFFLFSCLFSPPKRNSTDTFFFLLPQRCVPFPQTMVCTSCDTLLGSGCGPEKGLWGDEEEVVVGGWLVPTDHSHTRPLLRHARRGFCGPTGCPWA